MLYISLVLQRVQCLANVPFELHSSAWRQTEQDLAPSFCNWGKDSEKLWDLTRDTAWPVLGSIQTPQRRLPGSSLCWQDAVSWNNRNSQWETIPINLLQPPPALSLQLPKKQSPELINQLYLRQGPTNYLFFAVTFYWDLTTSIYLCIIYGSFCSTTAIQEQYCITLQ